MKISALLMSIVLLSSVPACVLPPVSSTGGSPHAALGPDGVEDDAKPSALPARLAAGLSWLWQSYTALKAKGLNVETLREAIGEMQVVVSKGDLSAALSLYAKARAIITGMTQ